MNGADWIGPEAAEFRKCFKDRKVPRKTGENSGNDNIFIRWYVNMTYIYIVKKGKKKYNYRKTYLFGEVFY